MPLRDYHAPLHPPQQIPVTAALPSLPFPGAIGPPPASFYPAGPTEFSYLYSQLQNQVTTSFGLTVPSTFPQGFYGSNDTQNFKVIDNLDSGGTQGVELSFSKNWTPDSGLTGLRMGRKGTWPYPIGLTLTIDEAPIWDTVAIDFETHDLILANSHVTLGDCLRFREDTAQCSMGRVVGQPALSGAQLQLFGGDTGHPVQGQATTVYGNLFGLLLTQGNAGTQRVKIGFGLPPGWQMGVDSAQNNTGDFWLANDATGQFSFLIGTGDQVTLGSTAGTSQVKLQGKLGFYNTTPVAKPTVTGSRGSGAALVSLLAALVSQGLIADTTSA